MLAVFIAAAAMLSPLRTPAHVPGLAIAQATTVSITASVQHKMLVDDDGNPTAYGDVSTKVGEICSGWVAYTRKMRDGRYLELIVTARHCTVPETYLLLNVAPVFTNTPTLKRVNFKDGTVAPIVAVLPMAEGDDLAFVATITKRPRPYAFLAPSLPEQAEDLFVYGMPHGRVFAYSPAVMMQDHLLWSDPEDQANQWQSNAYMIACPACGPGDSGGPVFNRRGEVVGIVNAQGDSAQTLMYPLEKLRRFLAYMGNPARF
jgi:hypothetical protein